MLAVKEGKLGFGLKPSPEFQARLRALRESIHRRHAAELSNAGFFRRLVIRWRITCEYHRERRTIVPCSLEMARRVLAANEDVPFGIFGIISSCPYFPPRDFLNEFLMGGSDPCDQDGVIGGWLPFTVSPEEYRELLAWWQAAHPGAVASDLGVGCWDHWIQVILNPEDWGYPDGLPRPAEPNAPPDLGGE